MSILSTGKQRKLHNEELYALYSSPKITTVIKSRRMKWEVHVTRMGDRRGAYRVLVGRRERRRPLERPRHRWESDKVDLQEVGWGGMDCIALALNKDRWRALVNVVMNFPVL